VIMLQIFNHMHANYMFVFIVLHIHVGTSNLNAEQKRIAEEVLMKALEVKMFRDTHMNRHGATELRSRVSHDPSATYGSTNLKRSSSGGRHGHHWHADAISPTRVQKPKQMLLYVHGGPGTGKSFLIETIHSLMKEVGNLNTNDAAGSGRARGQVEDSMHGAIQMVVTATTGQAAANLHKVGGVTIHHFTGMAFIMIDSSTSYSVYGPVANYSTMHVLYVYYY
jgi:hypothetical protein